MAAAESAVARKVLTMVKEAAREVAREVKEKMAAWSAAVPQGSVAAGTMNESFMTRSAAKPGSGR